MSNTAGLELSRVTALPESIIEKAYSLCAEYEATAKKIKARVDHSDDPNLDPRLVQLGAVLVQVS
jgi:hypothetical protein